MKHIETQIKKIKKHGDEIRNEVREKTFGYILGGLAFVVGLAWNDAIKEVIEYFFPIAQNTVWAKTFYAFILTFVIVIVTILLNKISSKESTKI